MTDDVTEFKETLMSSMMHTFLVNFRKKHFMIASAMYYETSLYKEVSNWAVGVIKSLYDSGAKIDQKIILAAAKTCMSLDLDHWEDIWELFEEVCKPLQELAEDKRKACLEGCIERLMQINGEYFTVHEWYHDNDIELDDLRDAQYEIQRSSGSDDTVVFDIRIYELLLDMGAPAPTFPLKLLCPLDGKKYEITLEGLKEREPELYAKLCNPKI